MRNFEKYIEFIKNNKMLVLLVSIALLLMSSILFTRISNQLDTGNNGTKIDYLLLKRTKSFYYFILEDKYYVSTVDPYKTDKNSIRATLGIPDGIDFEVLYPNLDNSNRTTPNTSPPLEIPLEGSCCD